MVEGEKGRRGWTEGRAMNCGRVLWRGRGRVRARGWQGEAGNDGGGGGEKQQQEEEVEVGEGWSGHAVMGWGCWRRVDEVEKRGNMRWDRG